MAVAAVERAEIVDVEEHKRESLLSTEGWKRGDEFATGGVACALALLPVAFFAPVYSGESGSSSGTVATTDTLVGVNGVWVIWLLCIPVFLALTAWTGLHFRCARGSGWGTRVAWSSVALLWA